MSLNTAGARREKEKEDFRKGSAPFRLRGCIRKRKEEGDHPDSEGGRPARLHSFRVGGGEKGKSGRRRKKPPFHSLSPGGFKEARPLRIVATRRGRGKEKQDEIVHLSDDETAEGKKGEKKRKRNPSLLNVKKGGQPLSDQLHFFAIPIKRGERGGAV